MGRRSSISEWGPSAWTFMHVVSFTYPTEPSDDDRSRAFEFMHAFAEMLPCARCREEWTLYLKENLPVRETHHLQSRSAFTRFLVTGHNHVNERLGKQKISYAKAVELYDPSFATREPPSPLIIFACLGAIVFIVVSFAFVKSETSIETRPALRRPRPADH